MSDALDAYDRRPPHIDCPRCGLRCAAPSSECPYCCEPFSRPEGEPLAAACRTVEEALALAAAAGRGVRGRGDRLPQYEIAPGTPMLTIAINAPALAEHVAVGEASWLVLPPESMAPPEVVSLLLRVATSFEPREPGPFLTFLDGDRAHLVPEYAVTRRCADSGVGAARHRSTSVVLRHEQRRWREHPLTPDEVAALVALDARLAEAERYLASERERLLDALTGRLGDGRDGLTDFELEAVVTLHLREDDPAWRDDSDNVFFQARWSLRDGDDGCRMHEDVEAASPLAHVSPSRVFHMLEHPAHQGVPHRDLLRVGEIWAEAHVALQRGYRVGGKTWLRREDLRTRQQHSR